MTRNKIVEILADPTKSFLANFVLGTLVFTIVSDGLSDLFWQWIEDWAKTQPWIGEFSFQLGVRLLLVLLVLAVIYFTRFTDWVKSRLVAMGFLSEPKVANVTPLEKGYPGLIVIMSSKVEDSPAEASIRFHIDSDRLRYCWIICTNRTWEPARLMVDRLKQSGAGNVRFYYGSEPIEDVETGERLSLLVADELVDDPNHIRKVVEGIYAKALACGLGDRDMIADYTGGTKGMTAGMLLACTRVERSLQYISQVNWPQIMEVQIAYRLKQDK